MLSQYFRLVNKMRISSYILLFFLVLSSEINAKDWQNTEPGIYGEIQTGFAYMDNVFRIDKRKESDYLFIAEPDLWWKGKFGKHFLAARYQGEYAKFFSLDEQDYNDHAVNLDVGLDFTDKFHVDLGGGYVRSHDRPQAPGTTTDNFRSPTRWNERKVHGTFIYGRHHLGAAEIELSLYGKQRRYANNSQNVRDRDGFGAKLEYGHPLTQKIRVLSVFRYNRSDFQKTQSGVNQDNQGYSFWLGSSWNHTVKTTSRLLLGYVRQISDESSLNNFSGIGVEANIFWQPKQNHLVTFEAFRTPEESSDQGSGFFISNRVGVKWRHDYEDLIHFHSGVQFRYDDYSSQDRTEKYARAKLGVSYSWTKSVELGCEYSFTFRDSSIPDRDYRLNTVNLFIKVSPTF